MGKISILLAAAAVCARDLLTMFALLNGSPEGWQQKESSRLLKAAERCFRVAFHELSRNFTGPLLNCVLVLTIILRFLERSLEVGISGSTGEAYVRISDTDRICL